MHLLALSGSLRPGSFNTTALRALQKLAPHLTCHCVTVNVLALPAMDGAETLRNHARLPPGPT